MRAEKEERSDREEDRGTHDRSRKSEKEYSGCNTTWYRVFRVQ